MLGSGGFSMGRFQIKSQSFSLSLLPLFLMLRCSTGSVSLLPWARTLWGLWGKHKHSLQFHKNNTDSLMHSHALSCHSFCGVQIHLIAELHHRLWFQNNSLCRSVILDRRCDKDLVKCPVHKFLWPCLVRAVRVWGTRLVDKLFSPCIPSLRAMCSFPATN